MHKPRDYRLVCGLLALSAAHCSKPEELAFPTAPVATPFELQRDSFPFANFGGDSDDSRVGPAEVVRMFGPQVCRAGQGETCQLSQQAELWVDRVNTSMAGGRCEGFALLSGLFSLGALRPDDFGSPQAAALSLMDNRRLGQELAYWFATQYVPSIVRTQTVSLGANDAVKRLAQEFSRAGQRDMFRVGMVRVDRNGRRSGGHALLAYAVRPAPGEANAYFIDVYDNNYPRERRSIRVDAQFDRWEYNAATSPDEPASLYVGSTTNRNKLYLTPVRPRLGVHPCPFCTGESGAGDAQLFNAARTDVMVSDGQGRRIGMLNGHVTEGLPGAQIVPTFSGGSSTDLLWRDDQQPFYALPTAAPLTFDLERGTTQNLAAGATLVGQGWVNGVENAVVGEEETLRMEIGPGGQSMRLVPRGFATGFVNRRAATGRESLVRASLPDGVRVDELRMAVDGTTGDATLGARGEGAVALRIAVSRASAEGRDTFEGTVTVPSGGRATLGINAWEGEGAPMSAAIDVDGDGNDDMTQQLSNEGGTAMPPRAPTDFVARFEAMDRVSLTWRDVATDEDRYELERREDREGSNFAALMPLARNTTSFVDTTAMRGRRYLYRLRAVNFHGNSDWVTSASLTTCDAGQLACSETCANPATSDRFCGATGVCEGSARGMDCTALANATGTCVASVCQVACATGFGDCDTRVETGCEVDTRTSAQHCGACGMTCSPGALCNAGRCSVARPVAPASLAALTSRRPTFRWVNEGDATGARVDVCRDRACTMVVTTLTGTSSATPMSDLPAGLLFWRTTASFGSSMAPSPGPTWSFVAPSRGVAVEGRIGSRFDVNGDGYADVAVGASEASSTGRPSHGAARVFHGGATGVTDAIAARYEGGAANDRFGWRVANAGDVNGDGFADLLVSAYQADPGGRSDAGTVSLYLGSADGLAVMPQRVLEGVSAGDQFGYAVVGAGDVNGDGFADVLVGANLASPGGRSRAGAVSLFLGSASGLSATASRVFNGEVANDQLGTALAGLGDANGDGFDDVALGAQFDDPDGRSDAGSVRVFLGAMGGLGMTPQVVLAGASVGDWFGFAVAGAGDLNGDGYADLVVGAPFADPSGRLDAGSATVFLGSANGVESMPHRTLFGAVADDRFGAAVARAGDTNGDGFGDLVVGAFLADPGGRVDAGAASVFVGSAMGLATTASVTLDGVAAGDAFATSLSGPGDTDLDGFDDVVVGAPRATAAMQAGAGQSSVFRGSMGGLVTTPQRVLEGRSTLEGSGGSLAMRLRRTRWGHALTRVLAAMWRQG